VKRDEGEVLVVEDRWRIFETEEYREKSRKSQ
jgi:hypothetical protein